MNKELEANATLSHYRIVSKIGEGGMGEVYLAQDTKLDRKVALKILPADVAADRSRLNRFVQEAKAASALNHPNIITIHEIEQLDSMNFIATEFIDGENLRQRMRHASMKAGDVLDVAIQCASALSAAHATAIVHRDIKPENIMIRRDGIVKVLDFGLAKLTERSAPDSVDTEAPTSFRTEPGTVVGTAAYMSPEQARGTKLDARTDIFSFGVVLYEMVAGRLPFEGSSSVEVTASILSEKESQPLARYSSNVPVELERIVSKALRKNREERYQTIKDIQIDLQSLKQDLEFEKKLERSVPPESKITANIVGHAQNETVIESSARPTIGEHRPTRQKALNKTSLIAVAGLLIIGLGVGGYFYLKSSPSGAIRSIAVLPFANTSDNPDMEYLSDGISESLINDLSKLPGMKVIARSSSFQYKSKEVDATKIANALGVEAILTGRVAQRGDTLLINVEMVDARDKTQVWGEQYNRKTADILQIQSEISREVAEKLRLRLTTGEQQQLVRRERANPQAYELLLKGRFHENKGGTEDLKRAVEYYQQAIAVDPNYGPAYSALSVGYTYLVGFSLVDPKEFMPKAEAAARKALELEESLDEAHFALGNLKMNTWQWVEAEREFKRAIELNPNLFKAHDSYSAYLSAVGRHEEAITEMKRAEELDPLSLFADAELGFALFKARKYDQAIEVLKKCLELDPNYALAHLYLAFTYAAKGMPAEAIAEHKESMRLGINSRGMQIYLGAAYAQAGDHKTALKILKQLETSREYVSPGELPVLYAALGQREEAFASFEKAYLAHDIQLQHLGVEPAFDSLRSDARFKDLMRRVGLPQ